MAFSFAWAMFPSIMVADPIASISFLSSFSTGPADKVDAAKKNELRIKETKENLSIFFMAIQLTSFLINASKILTTVMPNSVMAFSQRFYYPTLPALALLGARSFVRLSRRWRLDWSRRRLRRAAAIVVLCGLMPSGLWAYDIWRSGLAGAHFADFDLRHAYRARWRHLWYRLDEFAALPDDAVFCTSELGYPAALSPGRTVIDIAGLNETWIAHHGFDADTFFARYRPDLFYLPHTDYTAIRPALLAHPHFREHYDFIPKERFGPGLLLDLALRRGSPHYPALRRIVDQRPSPAR